jgi:hypothetical protein
MSRRVVVTLVSLLVLLTAAFLLVTASPILSWPVPGIEVLPMGTLLAWVGIVALPLAIYAAPAALHPPRQAVDRLMATIMQCLLVLAVAWAPICYALSGNLYFTFESSSGFQGSESALFCFFYGTIALVIAPIVVMLIYGLARWINPGSCD